MEKFRKKPVVIEAMQWNGPEDDQKLGDALSSGGLGGKWCHNSEGLPCIPTLESGRGFHIVSLGDFVIRGVAGEFYACKPDIFEQTYEPVNPIHQPAAPVPENLFKRAVGIIATHFHCEPELLEHQCRTDPAKLFNNAEWRVECVYLQEQILRLERENRQLREQLATAGEERGAANALLGQQREREIAEVEKEMIVTTNAMLRATRDCLKVLDGKCCALSKGLEGDYAVCAVRHGRVLQRLEAIRDDLRRKACLRTGLYDDDD